MGKFSGLTIFFPAYHDMGSIGFMVESAIPIAKELAKSYEIILIDDGSMDGTGEVCDKLAEKHSSVKVIHHKQNMGYGAVLRDGFAHASKEFVFYTDGDAQYHMDDLRNFAPLIADCDVVNGYKKLRSDPIHRIILGELYNVFCRLAFSLKIRDVDCDFRLFRTKVFKDIQLEANTGFVCVEMMKKVQDAGFRIREVPVNHYHRQSGTSLFFRPLRLAVILLGLVPWWVKLVVLKTHIKEHAVKRSGRRYA